MMEVRSGPSSPTTSSPAGASTTSSPDGTSTASPAKNGQVDVVGAVERGNSSETPSMGSGRAQTDIRRGHLCKFYFERGLPEVREQIRSGMIKVSEQDSHSGLGASRERDTHSEGGLHPIESLGTLVADGALCVFLEWVSPASASDGDLARVKVLPPLARTQRSVARCASDHQDPGAKLAEGAASSSSDQKVGDSSGSKASPASASPKATLEAETEPSSRCLTMVVAPSANLLFCGAGDLFLLDPADLVTGGTLDSEPQSDDVLREWLGKVGLGAGCGASGESRGDASSPPLVCHFLGYEGSLEGPAGGGASQVSGASVGADGVDGNRCLIPGLPEPVCIPTPVLVAIARNFPSGEESASVGAGAGRAAADRISLKLCSDVKAVCDAFRSPTRGLCTAEGAGGSSDDVSLCVRPIGSGGVAQDEGAGSPSGGRAETEVGLREQDEGGSPSGEDFVDWDEIDKGSKQLQRLRDLSGGDAASPGGAVPSESGSAYDGVQVAFRGRLPPASTSTDGSSAANGSIDAGRGPWGRFLVEVVEEEGRSAPTAAPQGSVTRGRCVVPAGTLLSVAPAALMDRRMADPTFRNYVVPAIASQSSSASVGGGGGGIRTATCQASTAGELRVVAGGGRGFSSSPSGAQDPEALRLEPSTRASDPSSQKSSSSSVTAPAAAGSFFASQDMYAVVFCVPAFLAL